jgi:predicted protein tyrosine phosphatase
MRGKPMHSSLSLLTICGLDELADHGPRGVTHVLSILDPGWPEPEAFRAYDPHHRTTLHFHDVIEPGAGLVLPNLGDVEQIIAFGRVLAGAAAADGRHLLVHCHMGISRSTAAMLVLEAQAHPHEDEDRLFARLREIRPQAWPNSRMVAFADELLGRGARLVRALARHYARQLAARPELAGFMQQAGRGREVDMGVVQPHS